MRFVQIIEFTTSRIDEVKKLDDEWLAATEGMRTASHSILCRDRDRPNVYLQIVEFPSYEDAMRNNEMPETADFASRVMALCDGEAQFRNLDLVDEASW